MKIKRILIVLSIVIIVTILFLYLYNRTYKINIDINSVYEINITTSYPYKEKVINNKKEIADFMQKLNKIRFTHPTYDTGKGWKSLITIKARNENGTNPIYNYIFTDGYVRDNWFRYKIMESK